MSLSKEKSKCTNCDVCLNICPTKVQSIKEKEKFHKIGDTGCIYCLKCVKACPEKALSFKLGKQEIYSGDGIWARKSNQSS